MKKILTIVSSMFNRTVNNRTRTNEDVGELPFKKHKSEEFEIFECHETKTEQKSGKRTTIKNIGKLQNNVKCPKAEGVPISKSVHSLSNRLKYVDLSKPPGITGEICNDLSRFERRNLVALRPACALGVLSLIGHNSVTLSGEKISFYALCVAPSAAGKEAHLRYFRAMCDECGMSSSLCAEPRSDKQLMQDLVDSNPLIYLIDEAHKFFGAALDTKSSNTYMAAVGDLLLELKTTNLFKVPRSVKAAYGTDIEKVIAQLENKDKLAEGELKQLKRSKRLLSFFENGIKNPKLWVIGYSTPSKSAFFVNEETINSGFIGRVYLFPAEENRTPMEFSVAKNRRPADQVSATLLPRFKRIMKSDIQIVLKKESENLFKEIFEYFEADNRLNHEHLGALYARGIEHVINIASILALETRIIDDDMLLYATKLYLHSIKAVNSELTVKLRDSREQLWKSANKIVKRITIDGPKHLSVLANHFEKCNAQIRKMHKEGNERAHYQQLERLINEGILQEQNGKYIHKNNM